MSVIKRPRGKPFMTATLKTGEVAEWFVHRNGSITMYAGWDDVTEKQMKDLVKISYALKDCLEAIGKAIAPRETQAQLFDQTDQ